MAMRYPADQARAAPRAATGAGHVGAGAGLVDKHQPGRIKVGLILLVSAAPLGHVGALLLAGVHDFF